jgi:hypothetical protein
MTTLTDTPVLSLSDSAYFAFSDLIMQATMQQVEQASVWYFEAQEVAEDVAEILGTSLEVGASIVAAFSPRERWATNVAKSYAFANGKPVSGLSNNLKMANDSLSLGFDALKGLKTNAFARAIAGDSQAVVIDVWMMRAANMDTDSPNKSQYLALSDAVRKVASDHGITPRTAQALIWIIVRGNHA